jgi:hypothetical protein
LLTWTPGTDVFRSYAGKVHGTLCRSDLVDAGAGRWGKPRLHDR